MLGRHCRIPATDYAPHHGCIERFDTQFRYPLRIGRRTTSHGNEPHPAVRTLHRVPEHPEILDLCLVRHDHQSNLGIPIVCHTVDQREQALILALLEIDHSISPGRFATEFQSEPRLADTRRTFDMQMMDAAGGEIEIGPSFRQVGLHFRRSLKGHPVLFAVRPPVQRQQPRRSFRPTGGNGRMLIAPPLDILAAVDDDSL